LFVLAISFASCESTPQLPAPRQQTINAVSTIGIEDTEKILRNGDIVLRTGNDVISNLFAQLNKTDKTFSHCGVAFQRDQQWWVYHSIGGEDNPDEKLRCDPFEKFVSQRHNTGYGVCRYPLSNSEQDKLGAIVLDYYQREIPFDMKFDLATDDRLYCAEMIYKAFNNALDTTHFFETTMHQGFEYVSTDNLFTNIKADILCHIVY
jgi:hypothetical protein